MDGEQESVVTVKKIKKTKEAFVNSEPEDVSSGPDEENENDEEEEEGDFDFDMDEMNLGAILQNFLVNEDGQNVCDILSGFKKSLDTQNKILMKIFTLLDSRKNDAK